VGHSWGSLIALEAASRLQERISHLVLVGTAYPMKVSQPLLDASLNEPEKALKMINVFMRSTLTAPPSTLGPGTWVYGASLALGRRVLASNREVNVFHRGFQACDRYAKGEQAITALSCPVLFLLGDRDQMTVAKSALGLISTARQTGKTVDVVHLPVGHHQMSETPEETLAAIREFLGGGP
jgi:pimeloyl-ACP methyl ester carboxylesterase